MTPEQYTLMHEIVSDLQDCNPDERDKTINTRCDGDTELKSAVIKLLAIQDRKTIPGMLSDDEITEARRLKESILDNPHAYHAAVDSTLEDIGPYKVIREIGRGGMGVVYECEQQSPRRRVAVKVVDSIRYAPKLEKRLHAEAQIQGQLQHPGIAQVFDAGVALMGQSRRPYFVMELIDGRPLHAFADEHGLSSKQKLELIAKVADGMTHAHNRGVVHRDLKPENILVTASGQPKILDFGIARFVGDATLAATTMTREGQILGTLAYMAPEQLMGNPDSIGPAADVYALGAIAFELLIGHPPLQLTGKSLSAAFRSIEMEEPPRLGTLDRGIDTDIDTIVTKCLDRVIDRRYSNAGELADDIRRYLANEPIKARPPSSFYRASKFTRRNRAIVAGTVATVVVLIGGIALSSYFALAERRQRVLTEQREIQARHNNVKAMRGLFASAQLFIGRDEPWDATIQLNSIDEQERGWEWNHLSLRAPWIIDEIPLSRGHVSKSLRTSRFINNHELFQFTPEGYTGVYDLLADSPRQIKTQTPKPIRTKIQVQWPDAPENMFALRTEDDQLGVLNTINGAFEKIIHLPSADSKFSRDQLNHDTSLVASHFYSNNRLTVRQNGEEVFHLDTGRSVTTGMQWVQMQFLRDRPYLVLSRWRDLVYIVDTRSWEVVSSGPAYAHFGIGANEQELFTATSNGIRVMSLPSLEYIRTIGAEYGEAKQVVVSADGRRVAATNNADEVIRVFDIQSGSRIFEASIGKSALQRVPFMSPDGRLIRTESPDATLPWIIDIDEPQQPDITALVGHESWIYQLAISPDGTILASSAPEGDIILWDLENGSPLARFKHGRNLNHNMDMPLIFSPDGSQLVYAELDPDSGKRGLTRIDLDTGTRSWIEYSSRNEVIDAVAKLIPIGTSQRLYHHTAVFDDGRILQSSALRIGHALVILRNPGEKGEQLPNLATGRADTGVAINPNGSTYATGEYLVLTIRDQETSEILHELKDGISDVTWGVCYSNDGTRLAIGTEDGRVIIYDAEFFEKLCDIKLPLYKPDADRNYIFTMVWTPDDKRLVTCTNNSIRILESDRPIQREHIVKQWNTKLDAARQALITGKSPSALDPAAVRVARIEQWAATLP
ncbi:MAG: protein kinase [Phycisphaerales bacterium]|nr:protein kinase [Phycisphaerales bacterium]